MAIAVDWELKSNKQQQKQQKQVWPPVCLYTDPRPGHVAQSVTSMATDAGLTADPGVVGSIPARSHTFVEIDHEIIFTVILDALPGVLGNRGKRVFISGEQRSNFEGNRGTKTILGNRNV